MYLLMPIDKLNNKKICIIYGGWSEEREISLLSGEAVYNVLKDAGYDVYILDLENNNQILSKFVNNNSIDIIFNLIHGRGGEDGLVQYFACKTNPPFIHDETCIESNMHTNFFQCRW